MTEHKREAIQSTTRDKSKHIVTDIRSYSVIRTRTRTLHLRYDALGNVAIIGYKLDLCQS